MHSGTECVCLATSPYVYVCVGVCGCAQQDTGDRDISSETKQGKVYFNHHLQMSTSLFITVYPGVVFCFLHRAGEQPPGKTRD